MPDLDSKMDDHPLERGRGYEGWIGFLIKDVRPTKTQEASITLAVLDAFGIEHKTSAKPPWPESGREVVKMIHGPVS